MYGNGYSMAIVLDHRSTATSLTGNHVTFCLVTCTTREIIICSSFSERKNIFLIEYKL